MDGNRAELRQKIEGWFELHSEEMLADLKRLIGINSVKGPFETGAPYGAGARSALTAARFMLEERGFAVEEFEDIIITADMGPHPPLMGILAHLDTVDPGEGWDTDPFQSVIKDGRVYGRGALDNKGPAVAAMYAMYCVRDLCPDQINGFRLILGSGEELGCGDIALYLGKNTPPPHVFTPDSSYPVVNIEKGRITPFFGASWEEDFALPRVISITGGKTTNVVPHSAEAVIDGFSIGDAEAWCREYSAKTGAALSARVAGGQIAITAEGASAHAATPENGCNAQTALIGMIAAMPFANSAGFAYIRALNRLFPHGDLQGRALGIAMSDEKTGALTVNFGVLRYSTIDLAGNFDSRTPSCADGIDLLGMTRSALEREGLKLTNNTISKCHHTSEDSPFVQALLGIYEEYTGNAGECLAVGGQTYVHEITGGVAFGCELPGIDNKIHGANEFIGIDQLMLSAKMFTRAILDMCGAGGL